MAVLAHFFKLRPNQAIPILRFRRLVRRLVRQLVRRVVRRMVHRMVFIFCAHIGKLYDPENGKLYDPKKWKTI